MGASKSKAYDGEQVNMSEDCDTVEFEKTEEGDDYAPLVTRETDVRLTDVQGVLPG